LRTGKLLERGNWVSIAIDLELDPFIIAEKLELLLPFLLRLSNNSASATPVLCGVLKAWSE
jgi:hypothetical protein